MTAQSTGTEHASADNTLPFSFDGAVREYFKIWIVNVLLNVLTLGMYSPWAKVRTKRYFYSHTRLESSTFEYLGRPRELLARRLLGLGLLLAGALGARRLPYAGAFLTILFTLAVPWLVMTERIFDIRNSAYRDVRFDWRSNRREMMVVFLLPLLSVFSCGLILPYYGYRRRRLLVANTLYGTTPLMLTLSFKDFGKIYLKAFAIALVGALLSLVLVAAVVTPVNRAGSNFLSSIRAPALLLLPWIASALLYSGAWAYPRAALSRLVACNTLVGDCRLGFRPRVSELLARDLAHAAGALLSLGLLIPWARIRRVSYELDGLNLRTGAWHNGLPSAELPLVRSNDVEPTAASSVEDRRGALLRDRFSRFAMGAIVVAIAVPALRYTLIAPPRWLDDLIGTALVFEFLALIFTTLLIPLEVLLVALVLPALFLRGGWFVRREDGRWVLRPWGAVVLWGLLVLNAPVLSVTPELTRVYAAMLPLLALSHFTVRKGESRTWVSPGGAAFVLLVVALVLFSAASSVTIVDTRATLSWIALGTCVCWLTPSRLRFSDACAGLLVLALTHQAFVTLGGLRNPAGASESHRIVLGDGDSYSFCEMPDRKSVFVALPTCMGSDVTKCRDDVIAEYDSTTFTLKRRYVPFDESFRGRMLHLVCLEDSILVGMSFTSMDGVPRRENVMELNTEDGTVLRRDLVGPGVGHRLLRQPDGSAVFVVSEYSSVLRRYSLDHRDEPLRNIDIGRSKFQARFCPFPGSLQTEVNAVRPSRGTGFFAEWIAGQRVSEVDLNTGRVVATYVTNDGGNHSLAIDNDYDRVIVTSLWGISVIDLRTGKIVQRHRTEMGPRLPIIDTHRNLVYVSTLFGYHVWVFDRRTFALRGKLVVGVGGRNGHLMSDGRYLLTGGGGRHVAWDLDWYARDWVGEP
ncbi:MAG TPA: DUF898 family protein [Myxococcota bacterium]|nr:DUF898 family protein [Myxococcota bacterium]